MLVPGYIVVLRQVAARYGGCSTVALRLVSMCQGTVGKQSWPGPGVIRTQHVTIHYVTIDQVAVRQITTDNAVQ